MRLPPFLRGIAGLARRFHILHLECRMRDAEARDDLTAAAACARAALRLDSALPWAHAPLARAALEAADHVSALPHLRALSALRPDDATICCALAVCLDTLDEPSEAVSAYRRTLALDPRRTALWKHLGRCLYRLGDWEGAESALLRSCACDPDDRDAYDLLGYLCWNLGRRRESCTYYQRAADLDRGRARLAHGAAP